MNSMPANNNAVGKDCAVTDILFADKRLFKYH